jgi:hypothetical protein
MTALYATPTDDGFNYPAFDAAALALGERGILTLNPANSELDNDTGAPQAWEWYMRKALRMVLQSDGICLLPGWEHSRGAQLEVTVGNALGLDVRTYDEWLSMEAVS